MTRSTDALSETALRWPPDDASGFDCFAELPPAVRNGVGAISTTRRGGVSEPPFDSLNLGFHVGDDPEAVRENRSRLAEATGGVEFCWLSQVHGTDVVDAEEVAESADPVEADGCVSRTSGLACAILTADCLPVLLCDRGAEVVAACHAGWRGLAAGVVEQTIDAMGAAPGELFAWLGPAIGGDVYEVGDDVRRAFVDADPNAAGHFASSPFHPEDRWVADLHGLATLRLTDLGVETILGEPTCTHGDEERFFSYRRDGETGRMTTAVWRRDRR